MNNIFPETFDSGLQRYEQELEDMMNHMERLNYQQLSPAEFQFSRHHFTSQHNRVPSASIIELSFQRIGSRTVQAKLSRADPEEKQAMFEEIIGPANILMTSPYGNFVIQKFFEQGNAEHVSQLASVIQRNFMELTLDIHGCRVVQKAIATIPILRGLDLAMQLKDHVLDAAVDFHGNHVVQKILETFQGSSELQFIIDEVFPHLINLSMDQCGCRVIQKILYCCSDRQTAPVLSSLFDNVDELISDEHGNYVVQHIIENSKQQDKSRFIGAVCGKVFELSQQKFSSNVVEKCIEYGTSEERRLLIEEVCSLQDTGVGFMVKHRYANYVVQKMIEAAEADQHFFLYTKIQPHFSSLRKYNYGEQLISKFDRH